jgi:hypothetical protein
MTREEIIKFTFKINDFYKVRRNILRVIYTVGFVICMVVDINYNYERYSKIDYIWLYWIVYMFVLFAIVGFIHLVIYKKSAMFLYKAQKYEIDRFANYLKKQPRCYESIIHFGDIGDWNDYSIDLTSFDRQKYENIIFDDFKNKNAD